MVPNYSNLVDVVENYPTDVRTYVRAYVRTYILVLEYGTYVPAHGEAKQQQQQGCACLSACLPAW